MVSIGPGHGSLTDPLPIWLYWDDLNGAPRAAYLRLCERTIRAHAGDHEVRVTNAGNIREWLPDLPASFESLQLAHRADFARAHLIAAEGGVWLDMDTIVLRPIDDLIEAMGQSDAALYGDERVIYIGTVIGRRNSALFGQWAEAQDRVLAEMISTPISWNSLGSELLSGITGHMPFHRFPIEQLAPIQWRDWRLFLSRTFPARPILEAAPWQVALYNNFLAPHLRSLDEQTLLKSERLIGRLLAVGIGEADPSSVDGWLQCAPWAGEVWRGTGRRCAMPIAGYAGVTEFDNPGRSRVARTCQRTTTSLSSIGCVWPADDSVAKRAP